MEVVFMANCMATVLEGDDLSPSISDDAQAIHDNLPTLRLGKSTFSSDC